MSTNSKGQFHVDMQIAFSRLGYFNSGSFLVNCLHLKLFGCDQYNLVLLF